MNIVRAWTDGSSDGRTGGIGGWGVVLKSEAGHYRELSGAEAGATNQRMEILAACMALEATRINYELLIHSDSAYVINCMRQKWYEKWRRNGWRNSAGEPVANRDLWERLLDSAEFFEALEWIKVKGHTKDVSANEENHRADELAVQARKQRVDEIWSPWAE